VRLQEQLKKGLPLGRTTPPPHVLRKNIRERDTLPNQDMMGHGKGIKKNKNKNKKN